MLYRTKVKPDAVERLNELRDRFNEIYASHGIDIVGHWKNATDPAENFYMASYRSEEDYEAMTRKLHSNPEYVRLTSALNEIRIEFSSTRLIPE